MLARMLEAIVAGDELSIPIPTLFEIVWRAPYNPLIHENKVHVTIHRLRAWLEKHDSAMGRAIVVRDGIVSMAEHVEVIVLEPPTNLDEPRAEPPSTIDRVTACLDEDSPLTARELQQRLGISRSALNNATRQLLQAGRIYCLGRGRALVYSSARRALPNHGP
jgi:hypothetical protein